MRCEGDEVSLKYAIYPPKMDNSPQVYYKDIIVMCIEGDEIIGARSYDYYGNEKIVSYLSLLYIPSLNKHFNSVSDFETSMLLNTTARTTWTFNTQQEAYIQKLWCLKKLRDYFKSLEQENRQIFNHKIPHEIYGAFNLSKNKYPEYFL